MVTWQPGYVVSVRETGTNKGSLGSASFSRNQSGGSARCKKTHPFLANRGGCIERYILVYSGHHLNQSL